MTDEKIDTKFYRTSNPKDQRRFCISMSRLYAEDSEFRQHSAHFFPEGQDEFHVMNTTVYLNEDFKKYITITGYQTEIEKTKSFLEKKTEIQLTEEDPLGRTE